MVRPKAHYYNTTMIIPISGQALGGLLAKYELVLLFVVCVRQTSFLSTDFLFCHAIFEF